MDKQNLSRRDVLSSIVVAGGAGALAGKGTTSIFSDQETYAEGNTDASGISVGAVDLDIRTKQANGTGVKYVVSLPESAGNIPAYLWVRASECPGGSPSFGNKASFTNDEALTVGEALDVSLQVECTTNGESDGSFGNNDGGFGNTDSGPERNLLEVLNELRDGRRLLCGGEQCLQPGETLELIFEVESADISDLPAGALDFELEFFAEQCRHNTATNPFGDLEPCEGPTGQSISFIAFCSTDGGALDPTIIKATPNIKDGPTLVEWETEADVEYVVVKAGQSFAIYDYHNTSKTSGTVTSDPDANDPNRTFFASPSEFTTFDGCPDEGSSNRGSGQSSGTDEKLNAASSCPCELAADEVGDDTFPDGGRSAKLEWEEDDGGYGFVGEEE